MADPNLDKLERQYEQAKARLLSARARKAEKDRKLDARRKIILGGALIEKASRDPEVTELLRTLVASLAREQDRKAFENWSPPAPEAEKNTGSGLGEVASSGAGTGIVGAAGAPSDEKDAGTGVQHSEEDSAANDARANARMEKRP